MVWRFALWGMILVLVVGTVIGSLYAARHTFFRGNPRFILEHVEVDISPTGGVREEDVRNALSTKIGLDNLYGRSLKSLRLELLEKLPIREAEIRRVVPNRLKVKVYGRNPVARLPGGFALLDAEAVVLPYYESPRVTDLPAITGIRGLKSFSPRDSMKDNRLLVKALYFLQCHDEMGAGLGIEVDFIKLEPALSQLHVYVRENTRLKIRQHAVIRLPDRNIEEQYGKALEILRLRSEKGLASADIDATYRRRIPVRKTRQEI